MARSDPPFHAPHKTAARRHAHETAAKHPCTPAASPCTYRPDNPPPRLTPSRPAPSGPALRSESLPPAPALARPPSLLLQMAQCQTSPLPDRAPPAQPIPRPRNCPPPQPAQDRADIQRHVPGRTSLPQAIHGTKPESAQDPHRIDRKSVV